MIAGIKYLNEPEEDKGTLDMMTDVSSTFWVKRSVLAEKEFSVIVKAADTAMGEDRKLLVPAFVITA